MEIATSGTVNDNGASLFFDCVASNVTICNVRRYCEIFVFYRSRCCVGFFEYQSRDLIFCVSRISLPYLPCVNFAWKFIINFRFKFVLNASRTWDANNRSQTATSLYVEMRLWNLSIKFTLNTEESRFLTARQICTENMNHRLLHYSCTTTIRL